MNCTAQNRLEMIVNHLIAPPPTAHMEVNPPAATTATAQRVAEVERSFLYPRLPAPRAQFTPLVYNPDGSADFYFETQGVRGIVCFSRSGELLRYSSTVADVQTLVQREFLKIIRPRPSL